MVVLGIVLMLIGGVIFALGEQVSCLVTLVGGAINLYGTFLLISECLGAIKFI